MRDIFAIEFHGGQSVAITAASKKAVAIEVANPRASSFAPGAYTRAAVTNQGPAAVVNLNVAVDGVYFVAVTTNASGSTYTLTVTQVTNAAPLPIPVDDIPGTDSSSRRQ